MVFGGSCWFLFFISFIVLDGFWRLMVILCVSWWFCVVFGVFWWFLVLFWWFLVIFGGFGQVMAVINVFFLFLMA